MPLLLLWRRRGASARGVAGGVSSVPADPFETGTDLRLVSVGTGSKVVLGEVEMGCADSELFSVRLFEAHARSESNSHCAMPLVDCTCTVTQTPSKLFTSEGSSSMNRASLADRFLSRMQREMSCCFEPHPASSGPPRKRESFPDAGGRRKSYSVAP